MKIFNVSKNKLIVSNAKRLNTLLESSIGLIGVKEAFPLILKTRFGIHTFGVRFPIDVLILDKENKIAALKENLRPFRIFFWPTKYNTVLELPAGTIEKTNTTVGDKLNIEN